MIELRHLRYFVALAETLHFGRAAGRLNMSQPPLTRAIAALERDLGAKLLARNSRRAQLTPAGRRFLEDARLTLAAFDQALRNAQAAERGELGALSIGFMMHAAHTVLPRLMRRFRQSRPGVHVELREMLPDALPDAVLKGRFDVAITFDPGPNPGLSARKIHHEPLCLVVPAAHRLADKALVGAADLDGEALIATPPDGSPTLRDEVVRYCRSGGVQPSFQWEAQLQQTIVSLVAEALGIALVPESMSRLGLPGVVFRPLKDAPNVSHLLVWSAANANPALAHFLEIAGK